MKFSFDFHTMIKVQFFSLKQSIWKRTNYYRNSVSFQRTSFAFSPRRECEKKTALGKRLSNSFTFIVSFNYRCNRVKLTQVISTTPVVVPCSISIWTRFDTSFEKQDSNFSKGTTTEWRRCECNSTNLSFDRWCKIEFISGRSLMIKWFLAKSDAKFDVQWFRIWWHSCECTVCEKAVKFNGRSCNYSLV